MKINVYLFLICIIVLSSFVNAVPANPAPFNLEQPDGSVIEAKNIGDERMSWVETLDGYTIIQNNKKEWVYAEQNNDNLKTTNLIVGKDSPIGLEKHLRSKIIEQEVSREKKIREIFKGSPAHSIFSSEPSNSDFLQYSGTIGTEYIVVIPVQFTDVSFSSGYNQAYYENLIFNPSNPGSMNSYYKEVSYGKLNVTGIVTQIVNSSKTMAWYGSDGPPNTCGNIDGRNGCIYELAREAVQLSNPNVDFSLYDKDGNGYVDHLMIVHAGGAQESSSDPNTIWSHRWAIQPAEAVDGKNAYGYTMLAEGSPVGTFAHEFGHDLGLPDLYNTATGASVVGYWDLMDVGSWGGSPAGTSPVHISAWGKIQLSWINSTNIEGQVNVNINQIETNQETYKLQDLMLYNSNEYFLVENRQKTGFDLGLGSYNAGLVVWHIDNKQTNNNGVTKKVIPEMAGGSFSTAPFAFNYGYTFFNSSSSPNTNANSGNKTKVYAVNIGSSGSPMSAILFGGIPRLQLYLNTTSKNVTQNRFFSFQGGVRCLGGECGNVSDLLKFSVGSSNPTTCSQVWGKDCSQGPPETFDNTFDSCSIGAGGDESINEIYINKNKAGFGEEIEVKCEVEIKSLSCGDAYVGDNLYIYYESPGGSWTQKKYVPQVESCENYSITFIPDSIAGEHQVRCITGYNILVTNGCGIGTLTGGIRYHDNDDANFTVVNNNIPENSGNPFYTNSSQPQTCTNMQSGSNCEFTWNVNATGSLGLYKFFTIANSSLPIPQVESEKINITITEPTLAGDVNGDCVVDILDLSSVGFCFGLSPTGGCSSSDINKDGYIDILDLSTVGFNFGNVC